MLNLCNSPSLLMILDGCKLSCIGFYTKLKKKGLFLLKILFFYFEKKYNNKIRGHCLKKKKPAHHGFSGINL